MMRVGRNDPCPCGSGKKYKKCCLDKDIPATTIPKEVMEHFQNMPREPFEKGGFLTGRPFIGTVFQGNRMRAVGSTVYKRPLDETFHLFLLRTLSEWLTKDWFEKEKEKGKPHPIVQWYLETDDSIKDDSMREKVSEKVSSTEQTGNIRSLLALAYDFYSLKHCGAKVLPKLLNRLRNEQEFQGARYEIAIGGLVSRAGFEINWVNDKDKHCEFTGTHKITGDKAIFEAKSHRREGIFGFGSNSFNSEKARVKIFDHVREAVGQNKSDTPLVIFDDLNLPLTSGVPTGEKTWFNSVEEQLNKYGFFKIDEYKHCGALFVTNFSWHFHSKLPPEKNELLIHFQVGGKHSLKPETIQYLKLASEQYGYVPAMLDELEEVGLV